MHTTFLTKNRTFQDLSELKTLSDDKVLIISSLDQIGIGSIAQDQLVLVIDLDSLSTEELEEIDLSFTEKFKVRLGHAVNQKRVDHLAMELMLDGVIDMNDVSRGCLSGWLKLAEERSKATRSNSPENEVLDRIIQLNQRKVTDEADYLDQALQGALKLLKSKYGYIYLYSEEKKQFTLNTWSKGVMPDCEVVNPQTCYELDSTGFWGDAVRQRKALIMNDFERAHPKKKGYPQGHVPIKRFLTSPIFHEGEIVAVVGAANKTEPYDQLDVDQVRIFMQSVWQTVLQRRYELENAKLLNAINQTPVSIVITDREGNIEYTNPYFTERTGYTFEEVKGNNPRILKSGYQDQAFYKELWDTISSGKTWTGELQNRAKDGSIFWESATITPLMDQVGVARFIAVKKDITQDKIQRNSLAQQERLLRSSESLAETGGWEYDVAEDRMHWTKNLYRIHGFDPTDATFDHINESMKCYPEEARNRIADAFNACLSEGKGYDITVPFVDATGKHKWIRSRTDAIKNKEGDVIRVIGSLKDVTKEVAMAQQKEEHLQKISEQERFLNSIIQSSNVGIGVVGLDGNFTYANETLLSQFKTDRGTLEQLNFKDLTHPDDLLDEPELIQDIILGKRESYRKDKRIVRRDGSILWTDLHASPIRDADGKVSALLGILVDISDKKEQERALRESEHRLRSLNDSLATILWTSDIEGKVNYINPYGHKFFKGYADRVIREGWLSIVHPDDVEHSYQKWMTALESSDHYEHQFRVQTDQGYRWIQVSASQQTSSSGEVIGWIGISIDITEQKQAQDELKDRERRFKAVVNSFEDIVFTLDHEGRHTDVFGDWVAQTGMKREDFIGKTSAEILGPEIGKVHNQALEKALLGQRVDYEWFIERDGMVRKFMTYLTPIKSEGNEVSSVLGVGREITDNWLYQKSLEQHSAQLSSLAEFSSHLLQLTTAQSIYDYVGEYMHQLVDHEGYTIVSRLYDDGRSFEIMSVKGIGDRLSKVLKLIGQHPLHMTGQIQKEVRDRMKSGEFIDLEMDVNKLTDAGFAAYFGNKALKQLGIHHHKSILVYDGRVPLASVSMALPKTHRSVDAKLVESLMNQAALALSRTTSTEQTLRNEQRLNDAQQIGQFGDWTYTMANDAYIFSETAQQMLHLSPEQQLNNAGLFELIHPDDRALVQAEHEKLIKGERVYFEHRLVIENDIKWFKIISNPILDEHGNIREVHGIIHDITQSKQAEVKLLESENRFRSLIEHNKTDIIVVKDASHVVHYASPSIETILGYTPAELLHAPLDGLIHPDDEAAYHKCFQEVVDGKRARNDLKIRMRHKDGSYRWMLKTVSDQREVSGVANFVENIKDIHEEEQAIHQLKESHHRYVSASQATKDAIYDYNIISGEVEVSSMYSELFGYDGTDFTIEHWENNLHPEDKERILYDQEQALLQKDRATWKGTYRMRAQRGDYRWVEERATIVRDGAGKAIKMIGALSDMTEHFEYQRSIEEQNTKLRDIAWMQSHLVRAPLANLIALVRLIQDMELEGEERKDVDQKIFKAATQLDEMIRNVVKNAERLEITEKAPKPQSYHRDDTTTNEIRLHPIALELAPMAYFTTNTKNQIQSTNKAFERLIGRERKTLKGASPSIFISEDIESRSNLAEMRIKESQREPYQIEVTAKRSDDSLFWSRLTGQPYLDQQGVFAGYFYSIKDISKERQSALLLKEKSKSLSRINEELKQFTYVITHDLKAPVNSIRSLIDLLQEDIPKLTDEQRELFNRANKNSREVKRMLDALLEYARTGNVTEDRSQVVLREVVHDIQASLHAMMAENNAELTIVNPDLELNVYPTHFHRILLNLIQNGIKFRQEAPPKILIKASETTNYWQIEVEDNGIGIDAEQLPHIFKLFYHKNMKSDTESHGIGLSVVRRLVQEHEGSIRVKSEVGKGTSFIFTILKA